VKVTFLFPILRNLKDTDIIVFGTVMQISVRATGFPWCADEPRKIMGKGSGQMAAEKKIHRALKRGLTKKWKSFQPVENIRRIRLQ
jgi:hypothetical protein